MSKYSARQSHHLEPSLRLTPTSYSTGQSEIRVLKDDAPVERTEYNDREAADSDRQLGKALHNHSTQKRMSNIHQSETSRTPSIQTTSWMSALVVLLNKLALTPSLVTMRVLRVPSRTTMVPLLAVSR